MKSKHFPICFLALINTDMNYVNISRLNFFTIFNSYCNHCLYDLYVMEDLYQGAQVYGVINCNFYIISGCIFPWMGDPIVILGVMHAAYNSVLLNEKTRNQECE